MEQVCVFFQLLLAAAAAIIKLAKLTKTSSLSRSSTTCTEARQVRSKPSFFVFFLFPSRMNLSVAYVPFRLARSLFVGDSRVLAYLVGSTA